MSMDCKTPCWCPMTRWSKIYMESQGNGVTKTILTKNEAGRLPVKQESRQWWLARDRHRPGTGNPRPRNKPNAWAHLWQTQQDIQWGKDRLVHKFCSHRWQPPANMDPPPPHTSTEIPSRWVMTWMWNGKLNFPEENMHHLGTGRVLDMGSEAWFIQERIDKLDFIVIKNLCERPC